LPLPVAAITARKTIKNQQKRATIKWNEHKNILQQICR